MDKFRGNGCIWPDDDDEQISASEDGGKVSLQDGQ